jgi:hypothetical protein
MKNYDSFMCLIPNYVFSKNCVANNFEVTKPTCGPFLK